MHFTTLIASAVALAATTVTALPSPRELDIKQKFAGNPFQLSNLTLERKEADDVTLSFDIYNPDPLADSRTTCSSSWAYGTSGWPTEVYESCEDTSFGWHLTDFESWAKGFTLEVKSTFQDPSVGKPPYDRVTIFGIAVYDDSVISCESVEGGETCAQSGNVTAPIDRSIAKR
ncbi:hypothetical protein Q7P37_010684 [Cladosporium fusiforme]